jgi:hypothetical protein
MEHNAAMRAAHFCAALGVASLAAAHANAEPVPSPPELSLRWTAPAACPTREIVLARTERLLGRDIGSALTSSVEVDARVEPVDAERWELRVASGAAAAEARRIVAHSCDELADATALLTALSIDPTLPVDAGPSIGVFDIPPGPAATAPLEKTAEAPVSPAPPADDRRRADAALSSAPTASGQPAAHVAAAFALWTQRLPGAAPGVDLEGGVALSHLGLRGELGFFPEQHAEGPDGTGGDLWMATVAARVTYAVFTGRPRVIPSAGINLAWLHGVGTNVENEASGDAAVVALEPALRIAYPASPNLAVFGEGLLSVALNQPRFILDGIGEVHQPGRFAGRFALGVEWGSP